ncbi:hypothetical protein CSW53_07825 [Rhodococcus ruber]|nr:hypothetical protein CSW53_07825 [Rhodococcus ruber]
MAVTPSGRRRTDRRCRGRIRGCSTRRRCICCRSSRCHRIGPSPCGSGWRRGSATTWQTTPKPTSTRYGCAGTPCPSWRSPPRRR